MADKVKKTKAPAKPKAATTTARKASARKETAIERVTAHPPTHQEIALLALQYWQERGRQHGQDQADWLRAERALAQMAS